MFACVLKPHLFVCEHVFTFGCVHQIHLKNRELENTKLSAELQMLKSVDVNKEHTIAQFKEEVGRLQTCLTEKEKQHREILAKVSPLVQRILFLGLRKSQYLGIFVICSI